MSKQNLEHVMTEARKLNLLIEQYVRLAEPLERLDFRARRNLAHARVRLTEANFWLRRALRAQQRIHDGSGVVKVEFE